MAIYRLLRKDVSFDPEAIKTMHSAYEQVCAELVATKIIEAAKAGQRDPAIMRITALMALGLTNDDPQQ
jgi:hypothetical protein